MKQVFWGFARIFVFVVPVAMNAFPQFMNMTIGAALYAAMRGLEYIVEQPAK